MILCMFLNTSVKNMGILQAAFFISVYCYSSIPGILIFYIKNKNNVLKDIYNK